jgi:glyoxylase-like metal-dependent hydrolase (beta-lactamase superfamily II)
MSVAKRTLVIETLVVLLAAAALGGCTPTFQEVYPEAGARVRVAQLGLPYSNVFLLRSATTAALVDAGSPGDEASVTLALGEARLVAADVKYVIVTHAHGDHAALARYFQEKGAKIVLGAGDVELAHTGHNDEMKPQNVTGRVLRPFVDFSYAPFDADVVVPTGKEIALDPVSLPGVRVRSMPGHTAGSVVVFVGERDALIGDVLLGGYFGGAIAPSEAGEHYYQADAQRNRCNIVALLKTGVTRFWVGHGGPVERPSIVAFSEGWPAAAQCR